MSSMADEKELPDLSTFEGFASAAQLLDQPKFYRNIGTLHCPKCGDSRRMDIGVLLKRSGSSAAPPLLAILQCVQCDTSFTAVVYKGPEGDSLAVLPSTYAGLTTPHTPPGVAYYLDQAQRSQATGANFAAVAMFRGALEHLLFEQGYKEGMCGQKLADLEKAIAAGTAPK
jgi:hypothetical protein